MALIFASDRVQGRSEGFQLRTDQKECYRYFYPDFDQTLSVYWER